MPEQRPTADALLARIKDRERARLRIYIGAAPGVGKTYEMLQEAHALRARGLDVVIGYVETYGDAIPRRKSRISRSSRVAPLSTAVSPMEEMDVDAILRRKPQACVVDELAHTNVPGSRNSKRHEDVLEILDAGIHVMTAVNIQHLETLNDAVARATGVRVRETVPDTFLDRADEVINVDVTVEELRNRLREGKIYRPEKVEQALANFFRKGNLSTLRELALRAVADEVGEKAASYRTREGLEPALIPERVMVCMSSNALAPRVIRTGARIAGRLGSKWYAVYVETPREKGDRISPRNSEALQQNIRLAESLGATVVRVKAARPADGLVAFAQREGVTHVIFGQSARSRLDNAEMESLTGLEVYYDKMAIFSNKACQLWSISHDHLENQLVQTLRQCGTIAPQSIRQYGSGDILFLGSDGIRSLKAREQLIAAAVSDIGSPVDSLVRDLYTEKGMSWMGQAIAALQPYTGRYWMVFPDRIFVLSNFPSPKISAWSVYELPFTVTDVAEAGNGGLFLRADDGKIYQYGAMSPEIYDSSPVEVLTPFLGMERPATFKQFKAIDVACTGPWDVYARLNPGDLPNEDLLGTVTGPTFLDGQFAMMGHTTHLALRFTNQAPGPATLASCMIHYDRQETT